MIFDPADREGGRLEALADSREIGMSTFAEGDIGKERLSKFCGEDHMYVDLDVGLGHG